jgi:hypothetical protein
MKASAATAAPLALASLLLFSISALAGEKAQDQSAPNFELFFKRVLGSCREFGLAAKDRGPGDFASHRRARHECIVGMLRPYAKGRACVSMVAIIFPVEPGYHCDAQGELYYQAPEAPASTPMTQQEIQDGIEKVFSKHAYSSASACLLANEKTDALVECLAREKQKGEKVFEDCLNIKFNAESDALRLVAFDHCIEYKLKL